MRPDAETGAGKRYPWMPDFFIAGAQKCGTTTLHHILAEHPDVFVPFQELFFFDIDDFQMHWQFFANDRLQWRDIDFERDYREMLPWYEQFFRGARAGQLIGEDSTTYFASEKAPKRIAHFNPEAKIIIMLRDPAERTYSMYWYWVYLGRAIYNFERTLQYSPYPLVLHSYYLRHIRRFLQSFAREQVHFVLLEQLVQEPASTVAGVCEFLGLSPLVPTSVEGQHWNRGGAPLSLRLALRRNQAIWRFNDRIWQRHLPPPASPPPTSSIVKRAGGRVLNGLHRRVNPAIRKIPAMRDETRQFLNALFARENEGLDELTGLDLGRYWYRD